MEHRRERLVVPVSWWGGVVAFGLVWGWLVLVLAGPVAGLLTTVGVAAACAALVLLYGSTVVEAGPDGLRVGRAFLPVAHVGSVEPLDARRTRALLGPEADARAWLHVRPYVDTALRVEVDDPADPAPYWLVSSRDPRALAAALGADRPSPDPDSPTPR